MTTRLCLRGGVLASTQQVADVFCADGKIVAIGKPPADFAVEREVEAQGCLVMPGVIDLAVCLTPIGTFRPNASSECAAAVAGGVTTVCSVAESQPVPDSPATVRLLMEQVARTGLVHLEVLGAAMRDLGDTQLSSLGALREVGCVGISNGSRPYANLLVLRRVMEYASSQDLTLFYHPMDYALASAGCVHEGQYAARLGLPGIPTAAETAALAQMMALVKDTGARVHFCRLSCAAAVDVLEIAHNACLPVTADVAIHHLFLTESAIEGFDVNAHVLPPLRTEADRERLRKAVAGGVIGAICSDHCPLDPDAKAAPFSATRPGIAGVESLLPLTLQLVSRGELSLEVAVSRLTQGPAEILGRAQPMLEVDAPADLCVVRGDEEWTFESATMRSAGRNTPFDGWQMRDRVIATVCGGEVVYVWNRD